MSVRIVIKRQWVRGCQSSSRSVAWTVTVRDSDPAFDPIYVVEFPTFRQACRSLRDPEKMIDPERPPVW